MRSCPLLAQYSKRHHCADILENNMEALKVNDTLFKGSHSTEDLLKYYNNWAQTGKYDEHLSVDNGYKGPHIAAQAAAEVFEPNRRPTVQILDVAAGTGKVSQELRQLGFTNIDALDPSGSMLAQARKKNLYNNYICDFLSEYTMPARNGFYDCITTSGGFGLGHIPADALHDLIRLTKKGGYIIIAMREEYIYMSCYNDILEPLMRKLENEQKWQMVQRTVIQEYAFNKAGVLYIFEVS
ncbi:uncharacterized protein LOC134716221 isoform X1 [Mytilus trossulus]|uniref:uncharacterized protein LOC134716221 isoform X1 n=2 Tax=Mytilus trossulus TaxID=6551 RepID=UPI003004A1F8